MAGKPELSHSLQLGEMLDSQRATGRNTDVILVCGNKEFPAHRMILAATTDYFQAMFDSGWEESSKKKIELPHVTAEEMDIILPFLYTGKVKDVGDPVLLKKLLATSHMMQIKTLRNYCYDNLCKLISCDSFLEIYELVEEYGDEETKIVVITFLAENFNTIITKEEFINLKGDQLQQIIQQLVKYKSSMDDIMHGLLKWAEAEKDREDTLLVILAELDLPKVSTDFLTDVLRNNPLVKFNCHILTLLTAEATTRLLLSVNNQDTDREPKLLCFGKTGNRQISMMYFANQNQWSAPKTLPFKLEDGMDSVWLNGYAYIIGGGDSDSFRTTPSTQVIKYCPAGNAVVSRGNLTTAVCQANAGVLDNFIYVVNGVNAHEVGVTSVQRYNPVEDSCKAVARTNDSHNRPHVLSFNSCLYVVGCENEWKNTVERYDPKSDVWTVVTTIPAKVDLCSASIFNGKLHVVPSQNTNLFCVYNFDSGKWDKLKFEGSPKKICALYPLRLNRKSTLFVCDDDDTLHAFETESGQWIRKAQNYKQPWSEFMTCIL